MESSSEVVSLGAIIKAVKELQTLAYQKSTAIEKFYRNEQPLKDNRGYPLIVHASFWKTGNYYQYISSPAIRGAFDLAATVYEKFANWDENAPLETMLSQMTQIVDKFPAVSESDLQSKLDEAREKGLKTLETAVIPNRFYGDYQQFVKKLQWINQSLSQIPDDSALWEAEIKTILTRHADYLLKKGPVTPEIIKDAYDSIESTLSKDELEIDLNCLYEMTKVCSVWTRHGDVLIDKKGNLDLKWRHFTPAELVEKLSDFMQNSLKNKKLVGLFQSIFWDTWISHQKRAVLKEACELLNEGGQPYYFIDIDYSSISESTKADNSESSNPTNGI